MGFNNGFIPASGGDSFGDKVFLVVDGGDYTTLQEAVDEATSEDTILVGPLPAGQSWGDVTFPAEKKISIVGLNNAQNPHIQVGKFTFAPTTGNINDNEVWIEKLYFEGNFDSSPAFNFSGSAGGRVRLRDCYFFDLSAAGSGDSVIVDNSFAGSSLYIDSCTMNGVSGNTGNHVYHKQGFTSIRNYSIISNKGRGIRCDAGVVEFFNSRIEINSTSDVLQVNGGQVLCDKSVIINGTTNGTGVDLTTAGAVLSAAHSAFVIATGTGYVIDGVAGTVLFHIANSYSNNAITSYNVKVKNTITTAAIDDTFTPSA